MSRYRSALAVGLVAACVAGALPGTSAATSGGAQAWGTGAAARMRWVPGEIVVRYERGGAARAARTLAANGARRGRDIGRAGGLIEVVRIPRRSSVRAAAARLERSPFIADATPNLLRFPAVAPDDPLFPQQWGLRNNSQPHPITPPPDDGTSKGTFDADADVLEAWDIERGSPETIIAVVDSGVDVEHPDIAANLWSNPGESGEGRDDNGVDDDGNGLIDDVNGWDFGENRRDLLVDDPQVFGFEHGTHVASIAAAVNNDATGISGVCPGCTIMPIKVGVPMRIDGFWQVGIPLDAQLEGMLYASKMGAKVITASFAALGWSGPERSVIRRLGKRGSLVVAAAGNLNGDNDLFLEEDVDDDGSVDLLAPFYPASYDLPNLVSVAASNDRDQLGYATGCQRELKTRAIPCAFTNWGAESVDISAPGVDMVGAVPGGGYRVFDGTSFAAPFAAGIAGLVASAHPDYTPNQIRNALLNSADRPKALAELRTIPGRVERGRFTRTNGRVNAYFALSAATKALPGTDGTVSGARSLGDGATGEVAWPDDVSDVYRKKLRKGRRYLVELDGPRSADLDLWIYRPGVSEIYQVESGCFLDTGACRIQAAFDGKRSDIRYRFRAKRDGVYRFHVLARLLERGDYELTIEAL